MQGTSVNRRDGVLSESKETPGDRIKKRREELRISQEELAERTGLGLRIIRRVEAGTPAGGFLASIAEALDVSPEYLRYGYDESQDQLNEILEATIRTRVYNPTLVQEYRENFLTSAKFRNGQNQSATDFEVLRKELYEDLDSLELEEEIRAFDLGDQNDPS